MRQATMFAAFSRLVADMATVETMAEPERLVALAIYRLNVRTTIQSMVIADLVAVLDKREPATDDLAGVLKELLAEAKMQPSKWADQLLAVIKDEAGTFMSFFPRLEE